MAADRLAPTNDARVTHRHAQLNGRKYHYLLGVPQKSGVKRTIILVHGWPDLSFGWRYQVPLLLDLGFQVVCLDIMGFGGTDAPRVPTESIELYGFKRAADDIRELARQLGVSRVVLGGHDWGGMIVYRTAMWHPELVTHLFVACTPYGAPSKEFVSTEELVKTRVPNFAYQLQLAGPEVEENVKTPEQIRQFLNALFGGKTPDGGVAFTAEEGLLLDRLPSIGKTRLLTDEESDYYVKEYSRNGLHGTLNWYRNRKQCFEEELELNKSTIDIPVLFIQATHDVALPTWMAANMPNYLSQLTIKQVEASHWVHWEQPDKVNDLLTEWFEGVVFGGKSTL